MNGLPWWLSGKEPACQCSKCRFDSWVRKIPWKKKWQPTLVFLPGKSYGQGSLVGYSTWICKRVRHDLETPWIFPGYQLRARCEHRAGNKADISHALLKPATCPALSLEYSSLPPTSQILTQPSRQCGRRLTITKANVKWVDEYVTECTPSLSLK